MGIKQMVSQIIRRYGTNNPFEIASQKNILVLYEPLGGIMGYFNTYKRIPMIHINCELDEPDQLFTCSHELGHSILHPKVNTPFLKRNTLFSIDRIEREANKFAVELLIPDHILTDYTTISEAASACGVPDEMAKLKSIPKFPNAHKFWQEENTYFNL